VGKINTLNPKFGKKISSIRHIIIIIIFIKNTLNKQPLNSEKKI